MPRERRCRAEVPAFPATVCGITDGNPAPDIFRSSDRRDGVKLMQRKPDPYDSSRWTGYSEPLEAEALMLVLALGAVCFLIIGLETL